MYDPNRRNRSPAAIIGIVVLLAIGYFGGAENMFHHSRHSSLRNNPNNPNNQPQQRFGAPGQPYAEQQPRQVAPFPGNATYADWQKKTYAIEISQFFNSYADRFRMPLQQQARITEALAEKLSSANPRFPRAGGFKDPRSNETIFVSSAASSVDGTLYSIVCASNGSRVTALFGASASPSPDGNGAPRYHSGVMLKNHRTADMAQMVSSEQDCSQALLKLDSMSLGGLPEVAALKRP